MKSKLNYRREIEKEGYKVVRGSFVGTSDDRIDRWYIEHADTPYVDRRGAGYKTLEEAWLRNWSLRSLPNRLVVRQDKFPIDE